MTSDARVALTFALLSAAACGNYSNEDLEYMNALPDRREMAAAVPVSGALSAADQSEMYRMTRGVATAFNGAVDNLLGLIDAVRAFPPTHRGDAHREWGPWPAEDRPGWLVHMVVTKVDLTQFSYELGYRRVEAPSDGAWAVIVDGTFLSSGGVRKGVGHVRLATAAARAAGVPIPDMETLDSMVIDYDTANVPLTVDLTMTNLPPEAVQSATYHHRASGGRGELRFQWSEDVVPGAAIEEVALVSDWIAGGEGRGSLEILSGDGAGWTHVECWGRDLRAVYIAKPWSPAENLGTESACAEIPPL